MTSYSKPPVVESIIHLSFVDIAKPEMLKKFVKQFDVSYPQQEPLTGYDVALNTTGGSATLTQLSQGYRLQSLDQSEVLLAFHDGFAVARLAPYVGWEHLRDLTKTAWSLWRKAISNSTPKRIGVRYVNRIDIPLDNSAKIEIDDYLNFSPRVPKYSKYPLVGFLAQATSPTDVEHWSVSTTSYVLSPAPLLGFVSVVLDIDVFRTDELPPREGDLWECIESVRSLKNTIFEACITDASRKLFK